jgi:hypothetical protein
MRAHHHDMPHTVSANDSNQKELGRGFESVCLGQLRIRELEIKRTFV